MRSLRIETFLLVSMLFATPLTALVAPMTCAVTIPVTPIIRAEGRTELVGDLVMRCTGGTPTPAGQPVPTGTLTLTFDLGITNRLFLGSGSPFTDALLMIDDPAPANQIFAPVLPTSNLSFNGALVGNGTGLNFGTGTSPNIFQGAFSNVNSLVWNGIPIDPPTVGGTRTYRVTNVRVNAAAAGPGKDIMVMANFTSPDQPILNPAGFSSWFRIADSERGYQRSITPGRASHAVSYLNSLFASPATLPPSLGIPGLRITEGYPGAFRTPSVGYQNMPGQLYNSEQGFTSQSFTNPAGLADFGTRLKAVFNNIPSGVQIFVSTNNIPATGSNSSAKLVSTGTAVPGLGVTQLPISNGSASAVWEVLSSNPSLIENFDFTVYPAFISGGTLATAPIAPNNITITTGIDSLPNGAAFAAQPGETFPPTIFSLNSATGLQPQLSVTLDPRRCLLGTTYVDPLNACAPGSNGPHVAVYSDSGVLTPFFSSSNTGGVQITGTFSGTTPIDAQLQVTAPGVAPGTYPQTLTFSANGANSVQIPFNVTVLPANNPIIFSGGITDALSFQSGSIVPGQIFALFGANFGPATLASGTLDANGKLGTSVANTQALLDGTAAPLLYVTQNQLGAIAPFNLKGKTTTQVQIVSNGLTSPAVTLPVSTATISINSANGSGGGGAVIINKNGTLNSETNRASVGDTIVIYGSFAGPFANGVTGTDGRTTTAAPYPAPAGPVGVTIGGVPAATIPYFGNVPTLVESAVQINVVIPQGVKASPSIPITITAAGVTSAPFTTIAVN